MLAPLVERRHESQLIMFASYVDLKEVFDSVHYQAVWEHHRVRGIIARIIYLLSGWYSGRESIQESKALKTPDLLGQDQDQIFLGLQNYTELLVSSFGEEIKIKVIYLLWHLSSA